MWAADVIGHPCLAAQACAETGRVGVSSDQVPQAAADKEAPTIRACIETLDGGDQASIREVTERPLRLTPKVVRQTIDEMTGILENAPLDTRVAWVRDLFERIDVDSRESHAVAVWKAATAEGVNRLDSVSEWLRR